jgi:hypothetical protein
LSVFGFIGDNFVTTYKEVDLEGNKNPTFTLNIFSPSIGVGLSYIFLDRVELRVGYNATRSEFEEGVFLDKAVKLTVNYLF